MKTTQLTYPKTIINPKKPLSSSKPPYLDHLYLAVTLSNSTFYSNPFNIYLKHNIPLKQQQSPKILYKQKNSRTTKLKQTILYIPYPNSQNIFAY